jgi:hypothetical protein
LWPLIIVNKSTTSARRRSGSPSSSGKAPWNLMMAASSVLFTGLGGR